MKSSSSGRLREDQRAVALDQALGVAQGKRHEQLARRARADRRVQLQLPDALEQVRLASGQPADPQPREAVRLGDGAERDRALVGVAGRGQAVGGVVLEAAVDLVAEEHGGALASELQRRAAKVAFDICVPVGLCGLLM